MSNFFLVWGFVMAPHRLRFLVNIAFKVGAVLLLRYPSSGREMGWFSHLTHLKKIVRIKVVIFAVGIRKGNFTICVVPAVWASSRDLLLKNLVTGIPWAWRWGMITDVLHCHKIQTKYVSIYTEF